MVYITKTLYYEVSCGVVVGWVLKVTWTGVWILQARFLQARCVSCRVSLAAPHTAMTHLIFAPTLGYIS
jgi:hypothetical protein